MKEKYMAFLCSGFLAVQTAISPMTAFAAGNIGVESRLDYVQRSIEEEEDSPSFIEEPVEYVRKNPSGQNLMYSIALNGWSLSQIKNGEKLLGENDYTDDGNGNLFIKKEYLENLEEDSVTLDFSFCKEGSEPKTLTSFIALKDAVIPQVDEHFKISLTPTKENGWISALVIKNFVKIDTSVKPPKTKMTYNRFYLMSAPDEDLSLVPATEVKLNISLEEEMYKEQIYFALSLRETNTTEAIPINSQPISYGPVKIDKNTPVIERMQLNNQDIEEGDTIKVEDDENLTVSMSDTMSGIWKLEYQMEGDAVWTTAYDAEAEDGVDIANACGLHEKEALVPLEGGGRMNIRVTDVAGYTAESYVNIEERPAPEFISDSHFTSYEGYGEDQKISVKLNGAEVSAIKEGEEELIRNEDYTLDGDGTITITKAYLESLGAGLHTLAVSFTRYGETLDESLEITLQINEVTDAARSVIDGINALGEITREQLETVQELRTAFTELSAEEQAMVFNIQKLKEAEDKLAELTKTRPISELTIEGVEDAVYTGNAVIQTAMTVRDGEKILIEGQDYTISYKNNTNAGTAMLTIYGIGNYSGELTKTFAITAKTFSETEEIILDIADAEYTGLAIIPEVTVKSGARILEEGTDFTVAYANNVNAGTATVTITGKGNYKGTKEKSFAIKPKSISGMTFGKIADQKYTNKALKPSVSVKDGERLLQQGRDYTVAYRNNKKAGKAQVIVTGTGNYTGTKTLTFAIRKELAKAKIAKIKPQTYKKGKAVKPKVTVTYQKKKLRKGRDYTVTYKKNKKVGKAVVIIKGKGNYMGTKKATFKIVKKK